MPNGTNKDRQNFPAISGVPNFPNPFNSTTTISYTIANKGLVELTIHDIQGRVIRVLKSGVQSAGEHQLTWDGTDTHGLAVTSGVYFCRLQLGSKHKQFRRFIKLTMLK